MRQNEMIEAVQESMLNHLWYLSQDLAVFALFDEDLPSDERRDMAKNCLRFLVRLHFCQVNQSFQFI